MTNIVRFRKIVKYEFNKNLFFLGLLGAFLVSYLFLFLNYFIPPVEPFGIIVILWLPFSIIIVTTTLCIDREVYYEEIKND